MLKVFHEKFVHRYCLFAFYLRASLLALLVSRSRSPQLWLKVTIEGQIPHEDGLAAGLQSKNLADETRLSISGRVLMKKIIKYKGRLPLTIDSVNLDQVSPLVNRPIGAPSSSQGVGVGERGQKWLLIDQRLVFYLLELFFSLRVPQQTVCDVRTRAPFTNLLSLSHLPILRVDVWGEFGVLRRLLQNLEIHTLFI